MVPSGPPQGSRARSRDPRLVLAAIHYLHRPSLSIVPSRTYRCTSAKLLAGWMQRIPNLADVLREEHEVLRYALSSIAAMAPDATVRPRIRSKARGNPSVDEDALAPGAKRLRRS